MGVERMKEDKEVIRNRRLKNVCGENEGRLGIKRRRNKETEEGT